MAETSYPYYILLSGPTDNTVKVAAPNGDFLGNLVSSGSGGLNGTDGLAIGADQNLYVGTVLGKNILRYEGKTGQFIDQFIAPGTGADSNNIGGLDNVTEIKFGPDGNLYVSNFVSFDGFNPENREPILNFNQSDNILVFSPSGEYVKTLNFPKSGPAIPLGLEFVGDDLLVSSRQHNVVYRFDTDTGAVSEFISGTNAPLNGPSGLVAAPDGNLYVSSLDSQQIQRYNQTTGEFIDIFVDATDTKGITGPAAVLVTPDEKELIVTGFTSRNAARIDFETGEVIDVFIPEGGNTTWGFGKNEGALIATPEMLGGPLNIPIPEPSSVMGLLLVGVMAINCLFRQRLKTSKVVAK